MQAKHPYTKKITIKGKIQTKPNNFHDISFKDCISDKTDEMGVILQLGAELFVMQHLRKRMSEQTENQNYREFP